MSISRRLALGGAAALAATGGNIQRTLAASMRKAAPLRRRGAHEPAQLFLELLIHHNEDKHQPHNAILAIPSGDTAWYAIDTLDDAGYRMTNHKYKTRGWRLKRVSTFKTKYGTRYSACWQLASGPEWRTRHGMGLRAFEKARDEYAARGFRMTHVDARDHYAAIWERGDASSQQIFAGLSAAEYESKYAELAGQGFRPARISIAAGGGQARYAAIFEKSNGVEWQERHAMTVADFRKATAEMTQQGFVMTDASGHIVAGKATFSAIWEKV